MFTVYIFKSTIKDWIYVGMTTDFERRIHDHNRGYNKSTRPYRPFKVILTEKYGTSLEARKKEKQYKSGIGKEGIKKLVASLSTDR